MTDFTQEQKEKYLASPNRCPGCGQSLFTGGPITNNYGHVSQDNHCSECGTRWEDIYKMIDVERKEYI